LALDVAGGLVDAFPGGVRFVDLAPLRDATLVLPTIAAALGVAVEPARGPLGSLEEALHDIGLLVVLDNCEHVLPAMPPLGALLAACPALKVLATSREPLGLLWEHLYPLGPLALPDPRRPQTADVVGVAPASALFVQRARAAAPGFALTDANAGLVAAICTRLDGLPLAIELAAARVRLLPLAALLAKVERSLDTLRAGERDRPGRHQTLRATLDWSYGLLAPNEARVLQHLAVFAGGCTLEAAEAVGADLDSLGSLTDKGLLQRDQDEASSCSVRFRLLETVRQYAMERLEAEADAAEAARAAHARYFLAVAERAEAQLRGSGSASGLTELEREWDNFQTALGWASEGGDAALSLRLGAALSGFGTRRHDHLASSAGGWPARALIWLDRVLVRDPGPPGPDRLSVLAALAALVADTGDYPRTQALLHEAVDLAHALGDTRGRMLALATLSWKAWLAGDNTPVETLLDGLAEGEAQGADAWSLGWLRHSLGWLVRGSGDLALAGRLFKGAVEGFRDMREQQGLGLALAGLADVAAAGGAPADAVALARDGLLALRGAADPQPLANVAEVAVGVDARRTSPRSAVEAERSQRQARVLGAVNHFREACRLPRAPHQRGAYEQIVAELFAVLGEAGYESHYRQGRALAPDAALEEALGLLELGGGSGNAAELAITPSRAVTSVGPLTPREVEVAALIARGRTSKEIAHALVITERTADTHASHIRDKLGLSSRAEIAAWAVRRGLVPFGDESGAA
jgi:non-specific serine/threonine protein kinase